MDFSGNNSRGGASGGQKLRNRLVDTDVFLNKSLKIFAKAFSFFILFDRIIYVMSEVLKKFKLFYYFFRNKIRMKRNGSVASNTFHN